MSLKLAKKGFSMERGPGLLASAVANFSGCSTHSLCVMPAAVIAAAADCRSADESACTTILCILSMFSGLTYD